ncbi:hypothetical protein DLJ53_17490 [Acuticoccus sediminis]|uniref:HK97 gp10 family phage protein n=1 Tax=Acuticoccus sediminis TaxID=2184697 RepID=A0A8B2NMY8_9HYPH|nr:HK97-gp10 family putative phage morphogenesis protein [Acuticoccus sediminis]RAI01017.1 hypothetical protein DLJ53_17490 [Acuticoccus sediminis]
MARDSFSKAVDDWIAKAERRLDEVVARSAHDVVAEAQRPRAAGGRMPVDSGQLRRSLRVKIDGTVRATGSEASVAALLMKAGQTLTAEWTAKYAAHVEFGTGQKGPREPAAFARGAIEQWPRIVRANALKVSRK